MRDRFATSHVVTSAASTPNLSRWAFYRAHGSGWRHANSQYSGIPEDQLKAPLTCGDSAPIIVQSLAYLPRPMLVEANATLHFGAGFIGASSTALAQVDPSCLVTGSPSDRRLNTSGLWLLQGKFCPLNTANPRGTVLRPRFAQLPHRLPPEAGRGDEARPLVREPRLPSAAGAISELCERLRYEHPEYG